MPAATIADPEVVEVLLDLSRLRLLAPFLAPAGCTVAGAAEQAGCTVQALGYWVRRFVRLGLLVEVPGERPARYQAAQREFLLDPSRVMPLEDLLDMLYRGAWTRLLQGYTREYRRVSEDWYVRVGATPAGVLTRSEVAAWQLDDPGAPEPELPLNAWGAVRLSRERAREVQARLTDLVQAAFEDSSDDEADDLYVFHLGLVRDAQGA